MSTNPAITNQPLQSTTILLLLSKGLERAGFYGLRTVLVLHLVSEVIAMDRNEALAIMGTFAIIVSVAAIVGGWIGDRFLNNKNAAIFGNVLQMLGAFICCIPSSISMYIGIFLIAIGTGSFNSNIFAYFGNLYRDKEDKIDSGFTGFYVVVNLGSFFGVLFTSYLYELQPIYAFFAAGFLFLTSWILVWQARYKHGQKQQYNGIEFPERRKRIVLFILISSLFWWAYNFGSEGNFEAINLLISQGESLLSVSTLYSMESYSLIAFGIVATFVWYLKQVSRYVKLIAGCSIAALSFLLLLAMNMGQNANILLLITVFALFSLAEILVIPTIQSLIVLYMNPKYLATIYSISALPNRFLIFLSGAIFLDLWQNAVVGIIIGLILFLICVTIVLLLRDKFKGVYTVSSEIDEIGAKSTNF